MMGLKFAISLLQLAVTSVALTDSPPTLEVPVYTISLDEQPSEAWTRVLNNFLDSPRGIQPFKDTYRGWHLGLKMILPEQFGNDSLAEESSARLLKAVAAGHPQLAADVHTLSAALLAREPSEPSFRAASLAAGAAIYVLGNIAPRNTTDAPPKFTSACTSTVAIGPQGRVLHGRSLDYEPRDSMAQTAVEVHFTKNGQLQYSCLHPLVYPAGLQWFTCLRPGSFSLSVNARSQGIKNEHNSTFEHLLQRLHSGKDLLLGEVAARAMGAESYGEALSVVTTMPVVSSNYFILAGAQEGQGAIVTRFGNSSTEADVWSLGGDADGQPSWLRVQTNVDHWQPIEGGAYAGYATHRRQHAIDLFVEKAAGRGFVTESDFWDVYRTQTAWDSFSYRYRREPEDTGAILRPTTIASLVMFPSSLTASLNASVWSVSATIQPPQSVALV